MVWRACMVRLVSHVKVDRAVRLVWTLSWFGWFRWLVS